MADLTYTTEGMFTTFFPMTKEGEEAWNVMHVQEQEKILSIHLKPVLSQLRNAGYSVRKAKKEKLTNKALDSLFAELNGM
jgi:hypothetical protein